MIAQPGTPQINKTLGNLLSRFVNCLWEVFVQIDMLLTFQFRQEESLWKPSQSTTSWRAKRAKLWVGWGDSIKTFPGNSLLKSKD